MDAKCTAISELGEIEVPRTLSNAEQLQRVKGIERQYRDQQPTIEGVKVLLTGYETHVFDDTREIQYNKLSVSQQGDVEAVIHRPLREGKPWRFPIGACAEAYDETEGQCVSHQLAKHIKIKGQAPFDEIEIAAELIEVTRRIYEDDPESPYEDNNFARVGFTAAAICELCKGLGVPIHIIWGETKIESFSPETPNYESVALTIWGDHAFFLSDTAKKLAMKQSIDTPLVFQNDVLASISRRTPTTPGETYWELYTHLKPVHFYS